jgi:hypothetical protein
MYSDHDLFKIECGISDEIERLVMEFTADLDLSDIKGVYVGSSEIQGVGVFANNLKSGELIGYARQDGKRTILGRYTNHAKGGNSKPVLQGNDVVLIATRDISMEEITVNYRDMVNINEGLADVL